MILVLVGVHDIGVVSYRNVETRRDKALSVGAVDEERRGGHQEMLSAES